MTRETLGIPFIISHGGRGNKQCLIEVPNRRGQGLKAIANIKYLFFSNPCRKDGRPSQFRCI